MDKSWHVGHVAGMLRYAESKCLVFAVRVPQDQRRVGTVIDNWTAFGYRVPFLVLECAESIKVMF